MTDNDSHVTADGFAISDKACPACTALLMAPMPIGEPGDDTYYCEACGRDWKRAAIESESEPTLTRVTVSIDGDDWTVTDRGDGRWQLTNVNVPTYGAVVTDKQLLAFIRTGNMFG